MKQYKTRQKNLYRLLVTLCGVVPFLLFFSCSEQTPQRLKKKRNTEAADSKKVPIEYNKPSDSLGATKHNSKTRKLDLPERPNGSELTDETSFDNISIMLFNAKTASKNGQFYEIAISNKVAFRSHIEKEHFWIKNEPRNCITVTGDTNWLKPGTDLNSNGSPNIIIWTYTGGMNCCLSSKIFEVDNGVLKNTQLLDFDKNCPRFSDLNSDGVPEIITSDSAFGYFRSSWSESYLPPVILANNSGTYQFSNKMMKQFLAPKFLNIKRNAKLLKVTKSNLEAPLLLKLTEHMTRLIYSGHELKAWQLLHQSWSDTVPGKKEFIADFKTCLQESKYYKEFSKDKK